MKENQTPWAVVQIGVGIIFILISVSSFIFAAHQALAIQNLFLGAGILLSGLSDNNKDKSERGKILSYGGSVFSLIGAILVLYNTFLSSN
jgi:hypothetical protein